MVPVLLALLACGPEPEPEPPGDLQVGVATARLPAPVGIGTAGFGPFGVDAEPSPYSEVFPATTRVHTHPDVRAVVLYRGDGHELVFVRTTTVGVFQQLRRAVLLELRDRLGRDLDDRLVLGATHTHSGPGRIIDGGGPYDIIADRFFPEHYDRFIDAIADTVEAAYADLAPGRVGWGWGSCSEGHSDRRCEDGLNYENGTLPVLAVEQEGELAAVVMSYAVHGTAIGIDQLTLSRDVPGGIEDRTEAALDHPVTALFFNSWAADMSPSDPSRGTGSEQPGGYDRIEAVGAIVAEEVVGTLDTVAWEEDPVLAGHTHRILLSRDALGYGDDTFPYPYGGVYCTGSVEADCDASTTVDDLDQTCIPFPEDYPAPGQTLFTAGQIGQVHFVTFPGEAGTLLGEQIVDEAEALTGGPVAFFGYAQDYTGYSVQEDDWWQGGYEASGALWGPLQGEHLADAAVEAVALYQQPHPGPDLVPPMEPFGDTEYTPLTPTASLDAGTLDLDAPATVGPMDTVHLAVAGGDPWLGAPVATLETADGTPVTDGSGRALSSDGPAFWMELEPIPGYREAPDAAARRFVWHIYLPVTHAVPLVELSGDLRVRVELPVEDGTTAEVISGTFTVER